MLWVAAGGALGQGWTSGLAIVGMLVVGAVVVPICGLFGAAGSTAGGRAAPGLGVAVAVAIEAAERGTSGLFNRADFAFESKAVPDEEIGVLEVCESNF